MTKFVTYINKKTGEYASWNEDYKCWVTHSTPHLFPDTHTKEEWVKLMQQWYSHDFNMTEIDDYELITVAVERV